MTPPGTATARAASVADWVEDAPDLWTPEILAERARLYRRTAAEAVRPTPLLGLAEWSARHVHLPPSAPIPGPVDLSRTPYLAGLMSLLTDPNVDEITWAKATQVGYSLTLICLLAYCAHHRRVPVLTVQPDDDLARAFNRSRVQPVMSASPDLRALLPRGRGITAKEILLANSVRLRFASSRSPAELAEMDAPVVLFDEVDKYPPAAGQEADPIKLGVERTRWWRQSLVVKGSTPTTASGYVWRELAAAECQMRFYLSCPDCGTWQVLSFDGEPLPLRRGEELVSMPGPLGRVDWPRDENGHPLHPPREIRERGLACYVCGECGSVWDESQKRDIVARGQWRTADGAPPRGHVGVHLWAAYSPMLSWSDVAAEYLESKDNPELFLNFCNSWLGTPGRESGERPKLEASMQRRKGYRMGWVPAEARYLTAFVDVHAALQYWQVWAWGPGFTGWLVDAGREDTGVDAAAGWDRVFARLAGSWPRWTAECDGLTDAQLAERAAAAAAADRLSIGQRAGLVLVDCGWDKPIDPDENVDEWMVLALCDDWNTRVGGALFQPSKGSSHPGTDLLRFSRSYDRDREGKPLKGRLSLHQFNPWFFKKMFYGQLSKAGEVGGSWLPADVPRLVVEQMLGEELVVRADGREDWVKRGANHWFDCAVGCLAAAWKHRLYLEADAQEPAAPAARDQSRPDKSDPRLRRPGSIRSKY